MTRRSPSQCRACARFRSDGTCKAYPDGIPGDMLFFGEDHRAPRSGDHGVQFVPGESDAQKEAFADWVATFG